jgi:hypothetical protein
MPQRGNSITVNGYTYDVPKGVKEDILASLDAYEGDKRAEEQPLAPETTEVTRTYTPVEIDTKGREHTLVETPWGEAGLTFNPEKKSLSAKFTTGH